VEAIGRATHYDTLFVWSSVLFPISRYDMRYTETYFDIVYHIAISGKAPTEIFLLLFVALLTVFLVQVLF